MRAHRHRAANDNNNEKGTRMREGRKRAVRPPPETNLKNVLARAAQSCLTMPDGIEWPDPAEGKRLVIEGCDLGAARDDEETVTHMLVESDNIHALGLLRQTHRQSIDLVYIDPPYNTGRTDLGYRDKFTHEEWIEFMFPRLVLAKDLLAAHGAIMVSIDDNEVHRLKLLLDSVFGKPNRIAGMIWQCRSFMRSLISEDHEHILVYARDRKSIVPFWSRTKEPTWFGRSVERAYANPDGDPRGAWRDCKAKPPRKSHGPDHDYSVLPGCGA